MNSLRLCGSAATTATLAMNITFIWRSLRAAADDADRRLTGCQVAAMASGLPGCLWNGAGAEGLAVSRPFPGTHS
jgi:hypothetical protein